MIKGSLPQETKTIINIHAPNIRAPKYIKQKLILLRREVNSNTIIVEDFNTPLSIMDRYPESLRKQWIGSVL